MTPDDIRRCCRIRSAFLLLATVFILISLYTYDPLDTGLYTSDPNIPAANKAGRMGAFISGHILFLPFGLGGWLAPVLTFLWASESLEKGGGKKLFLKRAGGSAAVLLSAAGLFSMSSIDTAEGFFLRGGLAGLRVAELMLPWLGRWGSVIFLAGGVAAGFLTAAGPPSFQFISWMLRAAGTAARKTVILKKKIRMKIPERKAAPEVNIREMEVLPPLPPPRREKPERKNIIRQNSKETSRTEQKVSGAAGDFKLPPLNLLSLPARRSGDGHEDMKGKTQELQEALHSYNVNCRVVDVNIGPIVSSFEVEPARGVKLSQITSLADDIALVMKTQSVRISPIPGKSVVGIEVPNRNPRFVHLREVLESEEFRSVPPPLRLGLGTDILGRPLAADLSDMPHLLVAGTTGSGKTICLNTIILSILFNASPDEVKFMMVDPKRVELNVFSNLPHLIAPVVTNSKKAARALKWVVEEMDKRYFMLSKAGVRNISSYNKLAGNGAERMSHLVVVIDELHDLMMVAQAAVEETITRLAQLSRAVGIHLVIATQRPSVDVITGVIKANLPCRISFQVSSKTDSRTILDANGAERLIGKGDMLFLPPGKGTLIRAQCSLVTDEETKRVADFLKAQKEPDFSVELPEEKPGGGFDEFGGEPAEQEDDALYGDAVKIVLNSGKGSTSLLQRRLNIGYSRAARLLDMMEERGIISPSRGTKPRIVLKQGEETGE